MRRAAGQRLADLLWPGRDPIGQRLQLQSTAQADVWWTVVGVSAPVLHHHLDGEPGFDWYRLAPACLLAVAAVACYVPARRATRMDPVVASRAE